MDLLKMLILVIYVYGIEVNCSPQPGRNHHVHHRIYVPQKIRTIYHTKIVKVPEHHHYFHEKEKIVHIETPQKEDFKLPLEDENLHELSDHDPHSGYYGDGEHNIFKKHVPIIPKVTKKRKITRGKKRRLPSLD